MGDAATLTGAVLVGHPRHMSVASDLPADLEKRLQAVGLRLQNGEPVGETLAPAIAGLAALPPSAIAQVATKIAHAARLYHRPPHSRSLSDLFRQWLSDKEQLLQVPDLKYLFLFHFDGRLREAAALRLTEGLPSSFLFAALAYRLNDWVEPVRAAALASARRCFPLTDATIVAATAEVLLLRLDSWGRWTSERSAIDAAFARADVTQQLADSLANSIVGPSSRVLKQALRSPAMDAHLPRLATDAKQPPVRALAVQTLADEQATWQAGWEWKWIDKSMGQRMRVPHTEARPLTVQVDREALVRTAAQDRSVLVRRQALDAIIREHVSGATALEVATALVRDRSPSVRERADFVLKSDNAATAHGSV